MCFCRVMRTIRFDAIRLVFLHKSQDVRILLQLNCFCCLCHKSTHIRSYIQCKEYTSRARRGKIFVHTKSWNIMQLWKWIFLYIFASTNKTFDLGLMEFSIHPSHALSLPLPRHFHPVFSLYNSVAHGKVFQTFLNNNNTHNVVNNEPNTMALKTIACFLN